MKHEAKTFKVAAGLAAHVCIALVMISQPAQARDSDLINRVLRQSLQEQAQVRRAYADNPAAIRPDAPTRPDGKIEVEFGDELGGGRGRLKGFNRAQASTYREKDVDARLEREAREVDLSIERAEQAASRVASGESKTR